MLNKNTVISQIINILENKKNKELKSYITMFLFKDNDTNKDVDVFCKTTQDIITRGENVCDINIYKRCQI